ncbi:MAG: M23 family metallopeptidase [Patescibacteria group bacterium]
MSDAKPKLTGQERYFLKRLRDDVNLDTIKGFLELLTRSNIASEPELNFSFQSLFKEVNTSSLKLTTKDRSYIISRDHLADQLNFFLYKSDLAFLFTDIANNFLGDINNWYQKEVDAGKLELDKDTLQILFVIIISCEKHAYNQLEITGKDDHELNVLLTDYIGSTAKLLLDLIKIKEDKDLNAQAEPESEEEAKPEEQVVEENKPLSAGAPQTAATDSDSGGTTSEEEVQTQPPDKLQEEQNDPLVTKNILFSKELREQAANFTGIALAQLEQQHGLPPGTLANSKDLQRVLSDKTLGFFLTTLGNGRLDDLVNPETRLTLIREYVWLVQNDFRTTALISTHLTETLSNNKNPELREKIETALQEAEAGTGPAVSELVTNLAQHPALEQVFGELKKEELVEDKDDYLAKEATKLLQGELQRIGVQADKLTLAEKNVVNVVDSWILQGLPLDLLQYVDEGRFKLIFGEEIPFNQEFLSTIGEIWIARRSIIGKRTGQLLLHNEAKFATQEALALLDENKQVLNKKEADQVFERAIATPTKQILVGSKEAPVKNPQEVIEFFNDKKGVTNAEKREVFLKQVWAAKDTETKKEILVVLGYGEAGSKTIQNIAETPDFYPKEIGLHDMAPLLGGAAFYNTEEINNFNSSYIPDNGVLQSPLANVNQFTRRSRGLSGRLKRGVKGLRSRLSKKAASKAADKAAEAGLSKAAATATTAIHPALGFLTKLATTKRGRQTLMALGGLGLGSLAYFLINAAQSLLTLIPTVLGAIGGGIAGFFIGGPVGAAIGVGIGAGGGFGIGKLLEEIFTGKKGQNYYSFQNGATGNTVAAAQTTTQGLAEATTLQPTSFIGQSIVHIGGQAVLGTIATVAGTGLLVQSTISSALVADFPIVDPLSTVSGSIPGKESEYVTIEKRAFIAGCPENKCENPAFPIKVEYTITITPKGNYTVQVLDATDTMKVNHSEKAWEEHEGKKPPTVPERIKKLADFPELYEEMIIEPGESVVLTYSESLDSNYNHSSVLNTFDLKVFAKDSQTGVEGTDNAITGEVIYIGDYSQGAGCWPASGTITQLPGGSYSHGRVDAFDIANSEGTTIFAPFSGKACPGNLDPGYGIHVVLSETEVGTFVFGHFRSSNIQSCKDVVAGEVLGQMGNTGNSSGSHLHFELRGSAPNSGTLPALMPDGASVKVNDPVRTCYE